MTILQHHPLIGRPVESDLRELVVSRGATGYAALHCIKRAGPDEDAVIILGIRHQREVGYQVGGPA